MKDYREMAEDVLKRREEYLSERRRRMKKTGSMIACMCLVVLLGAGAWRWSGVGRGEGQLDSGVGQLDGGPDGYFGLADQAAPREEARAAAQEEAGERDLLEELGQGQQADRPDGEACEPADGEACEPAGDRPVSESPVSAGNIKAYEEAWAGSYTDEEGHTVILLTENTEENRQRVFEMNPTLLESNTIFQEAAYSLAYLTRLQEKISEQMMAGELPFAIVSAVLEDANRIQVTVTTEDPAELEGLLALDEVGGAIRIVYSSGGAPAKELAVEE